MKDRAQLKPGDVSLGQAHEFMVAFGKAGGTTEMLQSAIETPELMKKLAVFIQRKGFEATPTHKLARSIMGKNFFGIEEAILYFGINPTKEQLIALSEIPFSEAALEEFKETYILVAVFPMSILEIRGKVERKLFHSHENEAFAKIVVKLVGIWFGRPPLLTP